MARKRLSSPQPDPLEELVGLVGNLDLTALETQLPDLVKRAEDQAPSFTDFALWLFRAEATAREDRRKNRNRRRSRLPEVIECCRWRGPAGFQRPDRWPGSASRSHPAASWAPLAALGRA